MPDSTNCRATVLLGEMMSMIGRWFKNAACGSLDSEVLFADAARQKQRAKVLCMRCLVQTECLIEALDNHIEFGVWGGMTERERKALLRRRPEVASWRLVLEAARRSTVQR
ncbi:WhiB family transcriptional regulator [Streptomyces sp. NPDC127084]|uniref:WhiB family transcriptional regulator n=1 Tax=Streptomyces sp. NPDC127084 TaxID=3347133 RepID=UPI0036495AD8